MSFSFKHRSLALLLDPEKANLDALHISAECCPDYIFVGGSTGGDTTAFVRALKEKLPITNNFIPRKCRPVYAGSRCDIISLFALRR